MIPLSSYSIFHIFLKMRTPRKILHVVHSLQVGGLENGLVNLLNRLDPDRFEQTVCCLTSMGKFAERVEVPTVKLIQLDIPATQFRFPLLRLAKIFRQLSPDVIHTRGWPTVDAVFAARLANIRHIVHGEHGREHADAEGQNWKRNQVRRLVGHIVDRYVIVCEFFRSWLNNSCKVRNERIVYIPNGVDTKKFSPLSPVSDGERFETKIEQRLLRQRLGLPADKLLLGTVGRLDPVKDLPTLFRGLKQITRKFANARLVIVGDGPIRPQLARIANELELCSSLLWLGERDDIPELLRCFDLFVQTSIFEGMSNTILEAMASGLPIVTTDTGGNPELVTGENGTLVPVGNVERLRDTLGRYLTDTELRKNHGLHSRARALKYFDLSLMAERYADMYEALGTESHTDG
jgi:sugar transferase (PEP-CTERM/EpsH1 system associated)